MPGDWVLPQGPYEPPDSAAAVDYANTPNQGGVGNIVEEAARGLTPNVLGRAAERGEQPGASGFDEALAAAGGRFGGQAAPGTEFGYTPAFEPPAPDPHEAEELPAAAVNEQYAPRGPDGKPISITDQPMSRGLAQVVGKQKTDEVELESRLQRTAAYQSWPVTTGVELAVGLLDPVNLALGVIPGVGEAAVMERLASAGLDGLGGRMAARAIAGAGTGVAQSIPLVALQGAMAREEGDEFGMREALNGVFQQAVFGAAIHAGIGTARELGWLHPDELMTRKPGEPPQVEIPPAPGSPETRAAVPETAYAPERADALAAHFAEVENAGQPVDLKDAGFAPHEIEALKRDGLAHQDGTMSEGQFDAWRDERELRQPMEPAGAEPQEPAEPEKLAVPPEVVADALPQSPIVRADAMQAGIAQVMDGRPVDVTPVLDAAAAAKEAETPNVAGLTVAQIAARYNVSRAKAGQMQADWIASLPNAREITAEERGARAAGVRTTPADAVDRQRDIQRNGAVTGVPDADLRKASEDLYAPKPEAEAKPEAAEKPKEEKAAGTAAGAQRRSGATSTFGVNETGATTGVHRRQTMNGETRTAWLNQAGNWVDGSQIDRFSPDAGPAELPWHGTPEEMQFVAEISQIVADRELPIPALRRLDDIVSDFASGQMTFAEAKAEAATLIPKAEEATGLPPAPIRSVQQIIDQERVGAKRAAEIQTEELLARGKPITTEDAAARKARIDAMPGANKLAAKVGEAAGVENVADKAPEQVFEEVVAKLPEEQVEAEIDSHGDAQAALHEEAEKQAKEWIVYHGTPHAFDQFDVGKIGTGEGAQAYGHGIYFAEAPGVANEYRQQLAGKDSGHLLTVRIKATPEEMLDWDRPIDAATLAKLEPIFEKADDARFIAEMKPEALTGETVYKRLASVTSPEEASRAFHAAGLRGIRYLDQGSRGSFDRVKFRDGKLLSAEAEKALGKRDFGAIIRQLQRQPAAESIDEIISSLRARREDSIADAFERHKADLSIEPPTRNVVVFDHNDVEITHRNGVAVEPHAPTAEEAKEFAPEPPAEMPPEQLAHEIYGDLRPEEELSHEVQQANSTTPVRPSEGGGGEPGAAAEHPGPVPAERGPRAGGAGAVERPGEEAAGGPEPATATGGRGGTGGSAAENGPAGAAGERQRDGHGNLIFKKGERVVVPEGHPLAGRHGEITEATAYRMQSILGNSRTEPFHSYTVRTDGGAEAIGAKWEPETGEAPAHVPDPVYQGHAIEPKRLADDAVRDRANAAKHDGAEARARTPASKKAQRQAAAEARQNAAAKEAVLDAWRRANPEAAAGIVPEPETPAPAAPTRAGNMAIVETTHSKGGYPLYVVTQAERVAADRYKEMVAGAKEGGGWYSSWKGQGGVPGFQFKDRAAAEAFMRRFGEESGASAAPTPVARRGRAPSEWKPLGQNAEGNQVFEDQHGVRSVVENGIRDTEAVGVTPGGSVILKPSSQRGERYNVAEAPTPAEVTEQAGQAQPEPAVAPAEPPPDAPKPPSDKGPHYAAGWNARLEGKPRVLPSYFTDTRGPNARAWFVGYDQVPNSAVAGARDIEDAKAPAQGKGPLPVTTKPTTPAERNVADALAPAQGKGPLPVTTEPPKPAREKFEYSQYLTNEGEIAANRATVDALNGLLQPRAAMARLAELLHDGAIPEGVARVNLSRLPEDFTEGDWKAAQAKAATRGALAPETASVPPRTSAEYGANNKLVTTEEYQAIRARLKAAGARLQTGVPADVLLDGTKAAIYHIEAGSRLFADFAREFIADIGKEWTPYLKWLYNGARDYPGVDARGMTPHAEVEEQFSKLLAEHHAAPAEAPAEATPGAPAAEPTVGGLGRYEAERLFEAHYGTNDFDEIAQRIADGETPAEIADSHLGDHFTEAEIEALAGEMEREDALPPPTERDEEDEGGIQGNLPIGDEGEGSEAVHGAEAGEETGQLRPADLPGGERDGYRPPEEQPEGQERPSAASRPAAGRGSRAGALPRIPDAAEGPDAGAAGRPADANVTGTNYSIEPGSLQEGRGPKLKARDNLAAIELTKRLIEEQRPATKAEQAVLAKYVGWGGLKGAFEDSKGNFGKGFEDIGPRLKELLTPEEYRTAAQSVQYAHYTSETVVRSMWDAVRRMGFKGGNVFEPGMGTGNFIGMMPGELAEKSQYQGIERDHLTAQIAKLLYPESGVREADYIKTPMPEGHFDLVIGNPPFSETVVGTDPKYAARGFSLHNYFFAKSLDSVRPGGLLGFVTTHYMMDAMSEDARRYLAERAELVGGIRLSSEAFAKNARTPVTTDILFFRKLPETRPMPEGAETPNWVQTVQRTLPGKTAPMVKGNVSRHFSEHPEDVLGEESFQGTMQPRDDYTVSPRPGSDFAADLKAAVDRLPENIMTEPPTLEERAKLDFASGQKKDGSFYVGPDGKLMQYKGGAGREVSKHGTPGGMSAGDREKVQHLIPIRDALREVFAADLDRDDAHGAEARERLNAHYDAFVAAHGPINEAKFQYRRPTLTQQEEARLEAREEARSIGEYFDDGDFDPSNMLTAKAKVSEIAKARDAARQAATLAGRKFNEGSFDPADMADNVFESRPNIKPFMSDPESYRLRSIEGYDDATGKHWKKDIFDHSILKFEQEPEIKSAQDGVLWSYNKLGRFDIDAIAEKMGRDRSDLIAELGDAVYKVPNKGETYQTKDEYLSGDIVSKLEEARAAAATDADIRRNIPALEAAMPPPLPPSEISMILGMPWIPIDSVKEFMSEHLGLGRVDVMHSDITGTWHVKGHEGGTGYHQWGTDDRDAFELLSDAMNRTPPRIYRWEGSGADRKRVFDAVATQAAQDKVDALKAEFATWVGADTARADGLAQIYNDALNRSVLRQYDGSYLTTPGVAANWSWRPHQTRVVARIVQSGNTYMAHAVGAGKTSAMIGSGMEMRRLGLVRKPLYVVPNHMLAQFTKEFYEQYPTAKISVADEQRFHTDVRRQFVSNAAQDDLDAVIMTHSSFGKIPISDDFQDHLVREQIEMYEKALEELDGPENRIARGRVEKQKEKLEQRLSKKQEGQDQTLSFEELGADFLFVDEAHEFRKLSLATKQSGLKGISPEGSNKAWDLYTKVRYLDSQRPGRSVVFASGTPVTNTMGELYSLSRYMQPAALASRGLSHFDSWAQAFGDTKTGLEENAAGGYQPVTRFGQFVNLPELYKMVGETMDIVTPKELSQYVTRPALQGGERQFHLAPRTDALDAYQQELAGRMQAIKNRKGPPAKGDDILLSVINDGRHAAIDPRFVEQTQSDPRSKLNMMVQNVARIYRETGDKQFYDPNSGYQKESFRGPATQMIFANLGVNGRGPMGFSTYQWIKEALRREGVPTDQIAFIGDYSGSIARQNLFNDMNEGKVRILVGSTQKMGTGVNAQRRLYAVHNLDPLWYPADDEQRVGRILRQGNHNPEIEVHDYSTKGTYDSAMWKMMGNKARFIEQFYRGDPDLRNMEDVGEASMYEQASAMATTDERILTLTQLKQDLDKARRRESAHDREQYSLRQQLGQKEYEAENQAKYAESVKRSISHREDTSGDKFKMTVAGKEFTDRAEAGEALDKAIEEATAGLGRGGQAPLGRIGGFALVAERDHSDQLHYSLRTDHGNLAANGRTGTGIIMSAERKLRDFDSSLTYAQQQQAAAIQAQANLRPLIGKPFEGRPEITKLAQAVRDLEGQLKAEAQEKENAAKEGRAPRPVGRQAAEGTETEEGEGEQSERKPDPEMEEAERRIAEAGPIDPEDQAAIAQATQAEHEAQGRAAAIDEAANCLKGGE